MRYLLLVVVACGGPSSTVWPVPTRAAPVKRTVTLEWHSEVSGHRNRDPIEKGCSRLVLVEEVLAARQGRELEIAATITDGDHADCGVGATLRLTPRNATYSATQLQVTGNIASRTQDRIRRMHARLGEPRGPFTFGLTEMPWSRPSKRLSVGNIDYYEFDVVEGETLSGPSRGTTYRRTRLRVRVADHAIACASHSYSATGSNFEWGGWSQREKESITIDYGDGAPACAPVR